MEVPFLLYVFIIMYVICFENVYNDIHVKDEKKIEGRERKDIWA